MHGTPRRSACDAGNWCTGGASDNVNPSLKLETISPPAWTARLLPAWSELLERAAEASIFLSPEWIGAWWCVYGGGHESRLLAAWDEKGVLSATPRSIF